MKEQYSAGDKTQVLNLMGQIATLKMTEGGSVDEYVKKARELRDCLINMGQTMDDAHLNQIILNGLPRSYDTTIQNLLNTETTLTFERLCTKLRAE